MELPLQLNPDVLDWVKVWVIWWLNYNIHAGDTAKAIKKRDYHPFLVVGERPSAGF